MPATMWNGLSSAHLTMDCTFYSVSIRGEILSTFAWMKMLFATKSFSLCPKMNLFPSWVAVRQMRLVTGHAFTAMVRTPSLSGLIFIVVFLAMAGRLMTMAT